MLTTDADDAATINLDAIRPSLRLTLAAIFRDFAAVSTDIGQHDLAARCTERASALEYGGSAPLAALLEGGEP